MGVTLKRLDHVNVRTANLDAMIDWYGAMLGMTTGPRPDFPFPGAWLYIGNDPVIHLVGVETQPPAADNLALGALRPRGHRAERSGRAGPIGGRAPHRA